MTLRNFQLVRIFVDIFHAIDVSAIQLWIDALRVHIERQRHHIDIAGAFAVTEQRALDTVSTRHQGQLGRSNARTAVIMRMQ